MARSAASAVRHRSLVGRPLWSRFGRRFPRQSRGPGIRRWHFRRELWMALRCYGPRSPPGIRCGDGCDAPEKLGWQNRICTDASGRCRPMIHLTTMRPLRRPEPRLAATLLAALLSQTAVMGQSPPRIDDIKARAAGGRACARFHVEGPERQDMDAAVDHGAQRRHARVYRSADW